MFPLTFLATSLFPLPMIKEINKHLECICLHSVCLFMSPAPPPPLTSTISPAMSRLPVSLLSNTVEWAALETQSRKGMGWGGKWDTPRRITMFGIEIQGGKSQRQKADQLLNITRHGRESEMRDDNKWEKQNLLQGCKQSYAGLSVFFFFICVLGFGMK